MMGEECYIDDFVRRSVKFVEDMHCDAEVYRQLRLHERQVAVGDRPTEI